MPLGRLGEPEGQWDPPWGQGRVVLAGASGWRKQSQRGGALLGLRRGGTPLTLSPHLSDVADVCAFLASEDSRYITGASVEVTGKLGLVRVRRPHAAPLEVVITVSSSSSRGPLHLTPPLPPFWQSLLQDDTLSPPPTSVLQGETGGSFWGGGCHCTVWINWRLLQGLEERVVVLDGAGGALLPERSWSKPGGAGTPPARACMAQCWRLEGSEAGSRCCGREVVLGPFCRSF